MLVPKESIAPKGPALSRIILGGWRWNDKAFPMSEQERLIETSLELGVSTFDHADIYGNYNCQYLFGKVLKKNPSLKGKIEIITKCGIMPISGRFPERIIPYYDTSGAHIIESAEDSLKAMNIEVLDVLLIHRPTPLMDADEIAEAFTKLKKEGKVKFFGVSNFSNEQFSLIQSRLDFPLVTNQVEISMSHLDPMFDGTLDYLQEHRVGPMAWSPLGGGKVFGDRQLMAKLSTFAKKYKVPTSALIIAWLLRHPSRIFPVMGTTNPDRLKEVAQACSVKLERQDWYIILKIIRGYDVP